VQESVRGTPPEHFAARHWGPDARQNGQAAIIVANDGVVKRGFYRNTQAVPVHLKRPIAMSKRAAHHPRQSLGGIYARGIPGQADGNRKLAMAAS